MGSCPEHEETLWLDVHGELKPGELRSWRAHLRDCPACREERRKLALFLEETRQALARDKPSPRDEARLGRAVLDRIGQDRGVGSWFRGLGRSWRPRPAFALAAACVAVVAAGWIWSGPDREPAPLRTASQASVPVDTAGMTRGLDGEILQNLELLKELDVIEKVVTLVDHKQISM